MGSVNRQVGKLITNRMAFARTVVEEAIAHHVIDNAIAKYPRIGEVYEAWKWRLAREPEIGYPVPNTNIRIVRTLDWKIKGVAILRILYTFDDIHVNIVAVDVVEDPPAPLSR